MLGTLAPLIVILGTATPGGGFPVYGAAVAETINEIDPTLAVQPRNTKGSTENVPLLEAGQLDIALVQARASTRPPPASAGRPPTRRFPFRCTRRRAGSSSRPIARTA